MLDRNKGSILNKQNPRPGSEMPGQVFKKDSVCIKSFHSSKSGYNLTLLNLALLMACSLEKALSMFQTAYRYNIYSIVAAVCIVTNSR